jgi:TolA-binding protein
VNPEVPFELERIIDKAIEKDRMLRYQHAADLKSDLARLKRDRESGRVSIGGLSESRSGVGPAATAGSGAVSQVVGAASASAAAPTVASSGAAIPAPVTSAAAQPVQVESKARRSNTTALAAAVVGVLVVGGAAVAYVLTRPTVEPQAPVSQPAAAAAATPEAVVPPVAEQKPAPAPAPVPSPAAAAPPQATISPAAAKPTQSAAVRPPAAPASVAATRTPAPAAANTPVPRPAVEPDPVARAVEAALPAMGSGQFDAALASLQSALGERPSSPDAAQARLLIARIYDRQGRTDAAMAAYADLRATYPKNPASADALLRMADLVQQTRRPDRTKVARSYLDEIVANFSTTNVAPQALAQRAAIEERENAKVTDPVLQRAVPAALVSYRQLTEAYPQSAPAEAAFVRLARFYDDMKRYDLQAQALTALGSHFPKTRHDAWWEAGEVFERRLRDVAKAKDAYSRVPTTSRRYRDAQKKLSEL